MNEFNNPNTIDDMGKIQHGFNIGKWKHRAMAN
jgi:hypothetical protein